LRIARRGEHDPAVSGEKIERFLAPKEAKRAGEFLLRDGSQCPVQ
jgi:hypothetical protein